jgi:hypothetical protein
LSKGAKVGVSIGVSLGIIGLACVLVTWLLLRRKRNQQVVAPLDAPLYAKAELESTLVPVYGVNSEIQHHEIGSSNAQPSVAELD